MKKKKYLHAFTAGIILFCGFLFSGISVSAKEKELIEPSSRLEWDFTDDLLPLDDDDPFLYGNTTLGQFQIHGGIQARTLYEGVDAFVVNGPITLEYTCDNSFQAGEGTKWELLKPDSKDEKKHQPNKHSNKREEKHSRFESEVDIRVNPVFMDSTTQIEADTGFLDSFCTEPSVIATISEDNMHDLTMVSVEITYRLRKLLSTRSAYGFIHYDTYDYITCREEYVFYVELDENNLLVQDLVTCQKRTDQDTCENGFFVGYENASNEITVTFQGKTSQLEKSQCFTKPGDYLIEMKKKLCGTKSMHIKIEAGETLYSISPKTYSGNYPFGEVVIGHDVYTSLPASHAEEIMDYGIAGNPPHIYWGVSSIINHINNGSFLGGTMQAYVSTDGDHWTLITEANMLDVHPDGLQCFYTPEKKLLDDGIQIKVCYQYTMTTDQKRNTKLDREEVFVFLKCFKHYEEKRIDPWIYYVCGGLALLFIGLTVILSFRYKN